MPPHSTSRQCRTVQNDTLTQEVWDVKSSRKCSRPSHLSLSASRSHSGLPPASWCFAILSVSFTAPLYFSFSWTHWPACMCTLPPATDRPLFPFAEGMCTAVFQDWYVTDSKECWIDRMAAEGFRKEPGWHWTARFPDSDTTTQNASRCRNCSVLHASGRCMWNKQESSQSG